MPTKTNIFLQTLNHNTNKTEIEMAIEQQNNDI